MSAYYPAPPTDVKKREEDSKPTETRRGANHSGVVKKVYVVGVIGVTIRQVWKDSKNP